MMWWWLVILLLSGEAVHAQNYPVYQVGQPTRGHLGMFMANGRLGDAGGALNGQLAALGIIPLPTNQLPPFCINDRPISNPAGYHQICVSADAFGGGGELTYGPIGGAANDPFTMNSGNVLALTSQAQVIELENLPQTVAGNVPVCIDPVTGQLYEGSITAQSVILTDDSGTNLLTDDSGTYLLTATVPAEACLQQ
jgi:hypothetical protein